jgi:hypothetical protein
VCDQLRAQKRNENLCVASCTETRGSRQADEGMRRFVGRSSTFVGDGVSFVCDLCEVVVEPGTSDRSKCFMCKFPPRLSIASGFC